MKKIIFGLLVSFGILAFAYAQSVQPATGSLSVAARPVYICPNINSNLYAAHRGDEVLQLQQFLFNYFNANIIPTGYFGANTRTYVQKFQKQHNISATGYVGQLTRTKIKELCGGGVMCPEIYQPVCAQVQSTHECCKVGAPKYCQTVKVACVAPVEQTFSNTCEMNKVGATYVRDGRCEDIVQNNEAPASCKIWYDGCNTCSRSYVGGPLACTMMACIQGGTPDWFVANKPVCREYFSGVGTAPVVKSFTGPVQLALGEKGIWKVDASSYNNSPLTYNITWGDEVFTAEKVSVAPTTFNSVVIQQTSFEHTYNQVGTYTVDIKVSSQDGQITKTSATIKVVSSNPATCLNAGISYKEGASLGCITDNFGRTACIADASYVCRNGVWKIEGGLPVF